MEVTHETHRTRWLGLGLLWLVAAALLFAHAITFRDNLRLLDALGTRGAPVASTPMQHLCPTLYADAQMWVRHALSISEGGDVRVRFTHVDNAPDGREVHWSSSLSWLLVGAGSLRKAVTGEPMPLAVENVLPWLNALLLLGIIALISFWTCRRAGLGAAVFVAIAMIGHDLFYAGFAPYYLDHHGLLGAAVLGLVLGAIFMGVGFWRASGDPSHLLPQSVDEARRAAVVSAVCGALGLWMSAATLLPAITITGIAALLAITLHGPAALADRAQFEPGVWRLWGRVGAMTAFAFYLLEYAPSHLGWRLEVNHPVYAIGWWGGSELIAQFAEWRLARGRQRSIRWGMLSLAVVAVLVAPIIILVGGVRVFAVFDPFVSQLAQFVAEGLSLRRAIQLSGWNPFMGEILWIVGSLALGLVMWWRTRTGERLVAAFAVAACAAFTLMAVRQIRWGMSASAPQICLIAVALAHFGRKRGERLRWSLVLVAVSIFCLPFAIKRVQVLYVSTRGRVANQQDAVQLLYRDVAAVIRASQPDGPVVLLASPNASVAIGYYGRFATVGTLYWENLAGTKAAAEIFSAQTELEARRRIRARGITHLAMISEESFLAEYFQLLHPKPAAGESLEKSFGYSLLVKLSQPMWLEQIPYGVPADLPLKPERAFLLRPVFNNPAADELYESALENFSNGQVAAGEAKLDAAIAAAPKAAEYWAAKANLLLMKKDIEGASAAVMQAAENATPGQRFTMCQAEAGRFLQNGVPQVAAELYRRALEARADVTVMNTLAWLLATCSDDAVRNGQEALTITEKLVVANQQPAILNTHAAALAECSRFPEAVNVATVALAAIEKTGDPVAIKMAQARLAAYRASSAWRQ